jgi:membrane protein involved in colicin uptake
MPEIVLPDGTRIGDQALAPPSVDAQFLAQGLQQIINGINGLQMQLDALIRMESQETSRSEMKSRIRRADEMALESQKKAEAEAGAKVEEMEKRDAEAKRIIAEREAALADEAEAPPAEDGELASVHDIGGEG